MIPGLLRKLLSAEFLGPVLVIAALQMLTYGISSSLPGTNVSFLFAVCLFAASLGWLLRDRLHVCQGCSRLSPVALAANECRSTCDPANRRGPSARNVSSKPYENKVRPLVT